MFGLQRWVGQPFPWQWDPASNPKKHMFNSSCNWTIYAGDIFGFQEYGKLNYENEHPCRSSCTSSSSEDSTTLAVAPIFCGVVEEGEASNQSWVADFKKVYDHK